MNDVKTLAITEHCDCLYVSEDEVYYVFHSGDNEGVTFVILDFVVTHNNGSFKYDYKPIIIENPYNASVDTIYNEIREVLDMKVQKYFNEMK